ncbi:hypothetical protein FMUND_15626 [Fusarium mundagurra]|uniref:DUF6594 domain-containing protein n=1 Tax=Fusarium mundagurra TaxID=1567541 RepID=A0A8H5XNJ9_9HYPO|nr:hypothetical protein FMUND_15626 [Fusarium mundagurra]
MQLTLHSLVLIIDQLLLQQSQILALSPASSYQYRILNNYIEGKNPILDEEAGSLRHPQDLVALGGPERDWIYRSLEKYDWDIFTGKKQRQAAENRSYLHLTSQTRLRRVVRTLVLLVCLFFLLAPILALANIKGRKGRLAVARNFEIAAALAAYAAVVVVFLSAT